MQEILLGSTSKMLDLGVWFSGGLDDFRGLLQPKWFYKILSILGRTGGEKDGVLWLIATQPSFPLFCQPPA